MLAGIGVFFTGLMLFAGGVNPFATLSPAPAEGVGLNPLLRHPSMVIHPPMLYSGYVAFSIPFAFAIGGAGHPPPRRRAGSARPAASR